MDRSAKPTVKILSATPEQCEIFIVFGFKPIFGFEVRQKRETTWELVKQIQLDDPNRPMVRIVIQNDSAGTWPEYEIVAVFLRPAEGGERTSKETIFQAGSAAVDE